MTHSLPWAKENKMECDNVASMRATNKSQDDATDALSGSLCTPDRIFQCSAYIFSLLTVPAGYLRWDNGHFTVARMVFMSSHVTVLLKNKL